MTSRSGTLVLDSEGLSKVVADGREVMALVRGAEKEDEGRVQRPQPH